MKRIRIVYLLYILIMIGCSGASTIISEVKEENLNNDVKEFVEKIKNSDGVYLFSRVGKKQYFIVNNLNVIQGEQASYINSIKSEVHEGKLIINLEELYTDNYQDKRIGKLRIFELNNDIKYDNIQIFKNEKEINIDLVGG